MNHKIPDPERDKRIEDEIIVDCYDDYEVKSAWECYLADNIHFPFPAKTKIKNKQGEEVLMEVEVLRLDKKSGLRVEVTQKDSEFVFSVRLLDLKEVRGNFETRHAINDWKYWKRR